MASCELRLLWANVDENRDLQTTFTEVSDVDDGKFVAYVKKSLYGLTRFGSVMIHYVWKFELPVLFIGIFHIKFRRNM
jgi:hypothetical protein